MSSTGEAHAIMADDSNDLLPQSQSGDVLLVSYSAARPTSETESTDNAALSQPGQSQSERLATPQPLEIIKVSTVADLHRYNYVMYMYIL